MAKHQSNGKYFNLLLLIYALILFIIFLLFELTARIHNLYESMPIVDIPSHLLAGLALGAFFYWALQRTKLKKKGSYVIVLTFFVGLIWEALEMLEELFIESPPYLKDFFFWDGSFDVIVTVAGAVIYLGISRIIKKRRKR